MTMTFTSGQVKLLLFVFPRTTYLFTDRTTT